MGGRVYPNPCGGAWGGGCDTSVPPPPPHSSPARGEGVVAIRECAAHHRSCPEYEQLKLLLHSGKSATMLPSIAASSSGHWNQDASRRWQRSTLAARDAQPHQHVAAERLDQRHALAGPRGVFHERTRLAGGQPVQQLLDQRQALLDLLDADPDAGVDVALGQHRHVEAQRVVRRIARPPPRVEVAAGGAADIAAGAEAARQVRAPGCRCRRCGPAATRCRRTASPARESGRAARPAGRGCAPRRHGRDRPRRRPARCGPSSAGGRSRRRRRAARARAARRNAPA